MTERDEIMGTDTDTDTDMFNQAVAGVSVSLRHVGNSMVVTIPTTIVHLMKWSPGDKLLIKMEDDQVVIQEDRS